jgi:hypothetical protein
MRNFRLSFLGVILTVFLGCNDSGIQTKPTNDPFVIGRPVTRIKGRLLASEAFHQQESDYRDLTRYKDVVLSLLEPNKGITLGHISNTPVCELVLEVDEHPPVCLRAVHIGKGSIIFLDGDGRAYARSGAYRPLFPDKYLNESGSLCILIEATIQQNDGDALKHYNLLRQSLGLNTVAKLP